MKYKGLVFFDLDGTLLNEHTQVSTDNRLAIQELQSNGYLPIIATGRTVKEIDNVLRQSGITSIIMMNGMSIYIEGEEVFSESFDNNLIKRLLQLTHHHQEEIAYYTPHDIYLSGGCQELVNHFSYFNGDLPTINRDFYLDNTVNMMLIGCSDKTHDAIYRKEFPEFHFFRNSPFSIDVIKAGYDKGSAVEKVKTLLNLQDIPTYAFGDGKNDISLLSAVDYPIAMENAIDEVKQVAKFITHHHNQDGIRYGLHYYHLI